MSVELVLIFTKSVSSKGHATACVQTMKISVKGTLQRKTGVLKKKAIELTINEKAI